MNAQEKEITAAAITTPPVTSYIVVLNNAFVYVGDVSFNIQGYICIDRCRNIRVWGTTQGLGQLRTGPTKETVLDECGTVYAPNHALAHLIPCTGF
jgi:hypothetical protein